MESFTIFLLLLCSILFICLYRFFIKFYIRKAPDNGSLQLPPGTRGWPFLGETLDYIYSINKGVPEKFVEDRRKRYSTKIFKTSLVGESMVIISDAEGNKFLFSNEKKLIKLWWPSVLDQLFPKSNNKTNTYESIRLRGMVSSFLKPDALRRSVGVMDSEMKQHLESDWSNKKVQVSSMAKKFMSRLSCKLFLSINEANTINELSNLVEVVATGLHTVSINLPGTVLNRGIKASKVLRKELEKLVNQRKIDIAEKSSSTVPQDAITHMLLNTDENGQFMNEFDIASHLLALIESAYGNIHNTITVMMMYLSELPDVYNNVLKEQIEIVESKDPNTSLSWEDLSRMKYTWNVASEVLRLRPPLGTFREAIEDFKYNGYLIPKGIKMHWIARAIHMNPEYFENPEKFDPTRFEGNGPTPYTYVPFGGGPRMCPGIEYARVVILVFIHNVVIKFRWEKLIPDEKIKLGVLSTPAYGLPIHLYPLKP